MRLSIGEIMTGVQLFWEDDNIVGAEVIAVAVSRYRMPKSNRLSSYAIGPMVILTWSRHAGNAATC
ncbi:MAG: hypothetical protein AAF862_09135 [Pseudomonadota bacterium]